MNTKNLNPVIVQFNGALNLLKKRKFRKISNLLSL